MHPEEKKPAVEVAFTMLHAGGKFSRSGDGVYHISGGLHGVGVAVSNALSKRCEVVVFRNDEKHTIAFEGGELKNKLKSEKIKEKRTGTVVRLWPDPKYFDSPNIPLAELEHLVRSKAYLLPGLTTVLEVEGKADQDLEVRARHGAVLRVHASTDASWWRRYSPASGSSTRKHDIPEIEPGEGAAWAIGWVADGDIFADSHVNLIPTRSGGTHEAGFRSGIFEALAAFMDTRALAPKGVKLIADDLWQRACFTLSARIVRTQFHGQTKEKLTTRHAARLLELCVRDAFELWLNEHPEEGKKIVELAIEQAMARLSQGQEVRAQEVERHRHASRQAGRLRVRRHRAQRAVPRRGRLGRRLGEGGARQGNAGAAAAARQGAEHHVEGQPHRARQQGAAGDRHGDRRRSAFVRRASRT